MSEIICVKNFAVKSSNFVSAGIEMDGDKVCICLSFNNNLARRIFYQSYEEAQQDLLLFREILAKSDSVAPKSD